MLANLQVFKKLFYSKTVLGERFGTFREADCPVMEKFKAKKLRGHFSNKTSIHTLQVGYSSLKFGIVLLALYESRADL